jgi:AraC family transcriptional regulator of adaptative response / DNA-3-methyladenine glycosylase II
VRLFARHVGASPSQVAKTARILRAKRLLDQTNLPIAELALQAGFSSIRRFNAAFAEVYRMAPIAIRRHDNSPLRGVQTNVPSGSDPSRDEYGAR